MTSICTKEIRAKQPTSYKVKGTPVHTVYSGAREVLKSSKCIVRQWKKHLEVLHNSTNIHSLEEAELEYLEVGSLITVLEITEGVKQLKSNDALGVEEICPEFLKAMNVVGLS